MARRLSLLIIFLAYAGAALATGNIAGKVTDEKTGEAVIGATVMVKGTALGTVTDIDGQFTLPVDGGDYTVEVKYLGYSGKEIEGISVKDGLAATLNIALAPQKKTELNEVTVRSSFKKENINALYSIQRSSATIQDGISADVIRRSPDRSTGDVLKRVSGTTVQDNKFIVVRGLNERYNVSMMNNATLPSTEPDKKAFSFDLIPANLIDNVIIYKTATPELPGDFAGGAVRISTKDFPEQKLLEVGVGFTYNDMTTGKDYYTGTHKGKYDALGFVDGSRNLPASFRDKNQYLNLTTQEQIAITKDFPDQYGYKSGGSSLPAISAQLTSGNTYKVGAGAKNKLGYIFSIGYRNARRYNEGSRDDYDISKTQLYHYNNHFYNTSANLGTILNVSYTYGRSKISLKNFFNNDFTSKITLRDGANYERAENDPLFIKSYSEEVGQNGLYSSGIEGAHAITADGKHKLEWNASYGRAFRNAPDQKIVTLVRDPLDGSADHPYFIKLNNINSPAIKDAGRVYSKLGENIYSAGANYTMDYKAGSYNQKFKAGVLATHRSREVDVTALGYASTRFSGQTIYEEGEVNFNTIFSGSQLSAYPSPILLANITTNSIDYTGTATLGAGYLMSENRITEKLKAVVGARAEYFQQVLTLGKAENTKENIDILPSINLTYALNDKANLRLSGFKSVNRPEFREFAPYRYYDYDNDFIVGGNPDLKRSTITNADVRYELYPGAGEILSGSLFYKNFKDPIEQINQGNNVLTYENVTGATVYGAEIEVRKKLGFIAPSTFLNNMNFYVNAAYIKGSVDIPGKGSAASLLQGQSPYILNTGLGYITPNERLSFNLLYNRIGERIRFRGQGFADIWEKSRNVIDLQIGQRLWKNKAEIKLTVSDLLNSPLEYYYKYGSGTDYKAGEDRKISSTSFGRNIGIAFRYNF
jgi:TonB-dependent receptor